MTMKKISKIIFTAMVAATAAFSASAVNLDSLAVDARAGYAIGGTLPTSLDNTIRKINRFAPRANFMAGVEATLPVDGRWSLHTGLRYERQGMMTDASVKNYDTEVVRGGESLAGIFIGKVRIMTEQDRLTLPLQAGYDLNRKVRLRGGLYGAVVTHHKFWGWAYDGYLREGSPVGPKIDMGTEPGERGDFDFNDKMRDLQWGMDLGADWQFHRRWGAFAEATYSFNNMFQSGFHTVQTLKPMYVTLGVLYRIK